MSRKEARELVFKLVYERCITGESNEFSFSLLTGLLEADDSDYVRKIYEQTDKKAAFLNSIIEKYSNAFKIERLYKIDLAILTVAVYEILFYDEIPFQVAVNEAVELSKKYSTEKSFRFVNGVLSSVIKDKKTLLTGVY